MLRVKKENVNTLEEWDHVYGFPEIAARWTTWAWDCVMKPTIAALDCGLPSPLILDIGTGIGMAPFHIGRLRPNFRWVGVDMSMKAIEFLRRHSSVPWCGMLQWDIRELPLPFSDKSFDVVFASELIEHLEQPGALIIEMARLARKRIVVTTPEGDIRSDHHVWAFTVGDVEMMLQSHGRTHVELAPCDWKIIVAYCDLEI